MWPIINGFKSIQVTSADGNAAALPAHTAKFVYIQADSGNSGTVQVLGTDGTTLDTNGVVLAAGGVLPWFACQDLSRLGYKASGAGQKLNILVGR